MKRRPLPQDGNRAAKAVVELATQDPDQAPPPRRQRKNPAAVALGRLGGRKGGLARAKSLTAKQRKEIAKKGGLARQKQRKEGGS